MEKLLKLLKEYAPDYCKNYPDDIIMDEIVISKRFGFIKWLVDNDNIDLDKLKYNASFTMLTHSIWLWCEWHTAHEWESILKAIWTNAIIAYLSIQDKQIEFLISILK